MTIDQVTNEDKLAAVQRFVKIFRAQRGESVTPGSKSELSCFMQGEGNNLLYRQLITTTEGTGDWTALEGGNLDLAYDTVQKDAYCIEEDFVKRKGFRWYNWMSE
tara:strand:+ start:115 stop:429 length:315 start_codon:yes stop_codon:yes gene_type:complete